MDDITIIITPHTTIVTVIITICVTLNDSIKDDQCIVPCVASADIYI